MYDGLDNLTDEQTPQGEVTYGYDAARRRSSTQVVGQGAVSYGWGNASRLTSITRGAQVEGLAASLTAAAGCGPAISLRNGS
ncbi:MAG: hypothetical protein ACREQD_00650, partial [Candidatus Binataceae bacterium]